MVTHRNQEDAVRSPELASEQQSISALSGPHSPAQQPPNSRQPVSASSAGIQQGACSSSKAMGHSAAIGEREAAEETSRTHNAYETPSTGRASAEKLGPNFGKLLATFQQRKSRSGEALTPQSDPGSAASKFSASLAVLQARSGHAMQRSSRRTSENTVTSTAATRHSRTHLDPGANAPSKQKAQDAAQAAVSSASKAACDSTAKSTHLKQQNSSGQEPPRPQAGPSFRAPAKDATTYPSAGASQQLAGAAAGPKLQQKAPIQSMRPGVGGRTSTPRCVLAIGQARVRCKGAEACDEHSAAAWAVTPADISAEASDLVRLDPHPCSCVSSLHGRNLERNTLSYAHIQNMFFFLLMRRHWIVLASRVCCAH